MIGEIGKVSDNRIIEAAYQSLVRLHKIQDNITKTDQIENISKRISKNQALIEKAVKRRIANIEVKMQSAPFWRKADKFAFMAGTSMIIAFSFILGRYPDTFIYQFTPILLLTLIATRYVHYILVGYHMYLVDFCYFANFMLLYLIVFQPKDEQLLRSVYLYASGPLSIGIVAFRNSLVYHKIDFLTSLSIHAIPLIMVY
jgi:hypothetical protein